MSAIQASNVRLQCEGRDVGPRPDAGSTPSPNRAQVSVTFEPSGSPDATFAAYRQREPVEFVFPRPWAERLWSWPWRPWLNAVVCRGTISGFEATAHPNEIGLTLVDLTVTPERRRGP